MSVYIDSYEDLQYLGNTHIIIRHMKERCPGNPGTGTINTLRPRQNGRHFPDDIFKWIFLNENV